MSDRRYRSVSLVLGLCAAMIAVTGLMTAVRGPATVFQAAPAAPPLPSAKVTLAAGSTTAPLGTQAAALGPINPTTPVTVSVTDGQLRNVQVVDAKTHKPIPGELASDGKAWHSKGALAYAATYQLTTDAVGADQHDVHGTATVATLVPAKLNSTSFIPAPSQANVGVGQPLVVRFTRAVTDKAAAERALQVTSSPAQPGSWFWMSATEAHYRPAAYWSPGTNITLAANTFGVDMGGKVFGENNRVLNVHVHDSWVAKADGVTHQMHVFRNGALVKTMPISLGSPKNPSHEGIHVVSDKKPTTIMDSCSYGVCEGQPGYYKEEVKLDVRISSDGEFVHSAPWSVRQQGSSNVSHGCINLAPANAQWFYNTFGVGDVVEITHSGGPILPVWDTYGDWAISWDQWQAGSALS